MKDQPPGVFIDNIVLPAAEHREHQILSRRQRTLILDECYMPGALRMLSFVTLAEVMERVGDRMTPGEAEQVNWCMVNGYAPLHIITKA